MLTDIQNKNLADKSYWVDYGKIDADYRPLEGSIYNYSDDRPSLGQFQVLAVEDTQTNDVEVLTMRLREVC